MSSIARLLRLPKPVGSALFSFSRGITIPPQPSSLTQDLDVDYKIIQCDAGATEVFYNHWNYICSAVGVERLDGKPCKAVLRKCNNNEPLNDELELHAALSDLRKVSKEVSEHKEKKGSRIEMAPIVRLIVEVHAYMKHMASVRSLVSFIGSHEMPLDHSRLINITEEARKEVISVLQTRPIKNRKIYKDVTGAEVEAIDLALGVHSIYEKVAVFSDSQNAVTLVENARNGSIKNPLASPHYRLANQTQSSLLKEIVRKIEEREEASGSSVVIRHVPSELNTIPDGFANYGKTVLEGEPDRSEVTFEGDKIFGIDHNRMQSLLKRFHTGAV